MTEKYVAKYVEIIDEHGERKGVCVTDTEHTVSFEVKDEYVAMELCDLLNKLYEENERLKRELYVVETDCKNAKESRNHYREENEQLKKELDCIKKTNKLYGYNVECDYEWYEEIDKDE